MYSTPTKVPPRKVFNSLCFATKTSLVFQRPIIFSSKETWSAPISRNFYMPNPWYRVAQQPRLVGRENWAGVFGIVLFFSERLKKLDWLIWKVRPWPNRPRWVVLEPREPLTVPALFWNLELSLYWSKFPVEMRGKILRPPLSKKAVSPPKGVWMSTSSQAQTVYN